jgi:hypothetical protein
MNLHRFPGMSPKSTINNSFGKLASIRHSRNFLTAARRQRLWPCPVAEALEHKRLVTEGISWIHQQRIENQELPGYIFYPKWSMCQNVIEN